MKEAFVAGGFGMWPTLVFGLMLLAAALRYASRPEAKYVPLLVSLGLLTLFSGSLGFVMGAISVSRYVGGHETAALGQLVAVGLGESLYNVAQALVWVVMSTLASALGALRLARVNAAARVEPAVR